MWADPEVTRQIGGQTATDEETWARVLRYAGLWALLGFGYWVVRERTSGRFVGEVGLADFRRHLTPSLQGAPEVGWALAPWAHGQGFATEAVRAVLAWWDAHHADAHHADTSSTHVPDASRRGATRTVCLIAPQNVASIRVAEKCGFREVTHTSYKGAPTVIFERPNA